MSLLLAWIAFPAILTALSVGCGLLVRAVAGRELDRALIPATGFALLIVVGQALTFADATADLFTPIAVALAIAGLATGWRSLRRPDGWALVGAVAVFSVYAAPIVLSGEATFAGYIRLDDTATWMALTDRVLEHGRDLDGLAPSTYEATLSFNLADGYPVGAFLPLGAAALLAGEDVAWVIQPYMAWLAVLLALALWSLARPLVGAAPLRAGITLVAAQPALLYGYYLWGGIKELAAAALVAAAAATVAGLVAARFEPRALAAPALLAAALIGVLSVAGAVWLGPGAALVAWLATRTLAPARVALRAAMLIAAVAVLALPVLLSGGLVPPTSAPLTADGADGNLLGSLDPAQVAGIWPAGDLRLDPVAQLPTRLVIAIVLVAALAGIVVTARRHAWAALAYCAGTLAACLAIALIGSPWVEAKALATASPAVLFAAGLAIAALAASGRALAAAGLAVVATAGVVSSNALAYRDVNLAPRDQLAELQRIGGQVAGEGPTLMTEYQPYGARHFLRDADAEGASELRRRRVSLTDGDTARKGEAVDTDALDPGGLLVYRTLVLRRSPLRSRPPAVYRLAWRGDFYEVWQRPVSAPASLDRIALGSAIQPAARPDCASVERLARRARPRGELVAAPGATRISVPLSLARYPSSWSTPGTRSAPAPDGAGSIAVRVEIRRRGPYEVWLGGSLRPRAELTVDGIAVGSVRHQLNNDGQYVRLGVVELEPGEHRIAIAIGGADLHPGSGGHAPALGPLVFAAAGADAERKLLRVDAAAADRLCDRELDWIEVASE